MILLQTSRFSFLTIAAIILNSKDEANPISSQLRQLESAIQVSLSKSNGLETAIMLHYKDIEIIERGIPEPHQLYTSVRNSLQFCLWKKYTQI